jgi:uncharacterized protein (DUF885 family)
MQKNKEVKLTEDQEQRIEDALDCLDALNAKDLDEKFQAQFDNCCKKMKEAQEAQSFDKFEKVEDKILALHRAVFASNVDTGKNEEEKEPVSPNGSEETGAPTSEDTTDSGSNDDLNPGGTAPETSDDASDNTDS